MTSAGPRALLLLLCLGCDAKQEPTLPLIGDLPAESDGSTGAESSSSAGSSGDQDQTSGSGAPDGPSPCAGATDPISGAALAFVQSDSLIVRLASTASTCEDPVGPLSCGPNWLVHLVLPAEMQAPGLYTLRGDPFAGFREKGVDEGAGACGEMEGDITATLEVLAIDATQVVGRLCDVSAPFVLNTVDLVGSFSAQRCP